MGALTGQTIAASYEQLLHVDTDGGGATTTLVPVKDGDNGTTFCLQLATTSALISGSGSKLLFSDNGGEYISGDGTDLTITSGADIILTAGSFVGVGTTDPAKLVHISGAADNATLEGVQIDNTDWASGETSQAVAINMRMKQNSTMRDAGRITVGKDDDWDDAAATDSHMTFKTMVSNTLTEHMRITSAGNVGIGQSSPSSANSTTTFLHIGSSSSDLSGLVLESDENKWEIRESGHLYFLDGTANHLLIKNNGNVGIGSGDPDKLLHLAGSATAVIRLENTGTALGDGDVLGTIEFEGQDASSSASGVRASISGVTQNASGGAYLAFSTANSTSSNAEAMRIIADGKVGVGTHEPDVPLTVKDEMASNAVAKFWNDGDNTNRYGIVVKCGEDSESGTNQHLIAQDGNGDITGVLKSVGGTFQLADSSDIRLKENIKDTTIEGIETVNKIKVRDFDWKKNDNTVIGGFIANELQEVYPQAVDGEPDAVDNDGSIKAMTVSRDVLVPLLVKAVQELSAKVEALENA